MQCGLKVVSKLPGANKVLNVMRLFSWEPSFNQQTDIYNTPTTYHIITNSVLKQDIHDTHDLTYLQDISHSKFRPTGIT